MICKVTTTHKNNNDTKLLKQFLDWLLSRKRQSDMSRSGRSFRRKTARFWSIWAVPSIIDGIHRVVYVDGIYLTRKTVILIARSDDHVLGWYMARNENSNAWAALMTRIAPPDMVVCDGGSSSKKARRKVWQTQKYSAASFMRFRR